MSGGAAIAAVTAALRSLLSEAMATDAELADTVFTMQSPDLARTGTITSNQLNLFLFRTSVNAAWSNQPIPGRALAGEDAPPPLALTLSYLLTAYGRDNDTQRPFSHLLLGRAMGVLHDNPIISADALRSALPEAELPRQIERVRLTLQPMSLDDVTKLWSGFQTQFRLSTAYEASVVLIESRRPIRAALPVLRRGQAGAGVGVQPDPLPPGPLLSDVQPASITVGDTIVARGIHLAADKVTVRLSRDGVFWDFPVASGSTDGQVRAVVTGGRGLAAGVHAVAVLAGAADRLVPSNALALAVMPRIVSLLPVSVSRRSAGASFDIDLDPPLQPGQMASMLVGSREIVLPPRTAPQTRVAVPLTTLAAGIYVLRIRVDGVDSQVIRTSADKLPEFDPSASLTVTA